MTPQNMNILTLTATSTISTLETVTSVLSMRNPVVIGLNPQRSNICHLIKVKPSATEIISTLVEDI